MHACVCVCGSVIRLVNCGGNVEGGGGGGVGGVGHMLCFPLVRIAQFSIISWEKSVKTVG